MVSKLDKDPPDFFQEDLTSSICASLSNEQTENWSNKETDSHENFFGEGKYMKKYKTERVFTVESLVKLVCHISRLSRIFRLFYLS